MAYNSLQQLRTNIEAIRIALRAYAGFGPKSRRAEDMLTQGKTYLSEETVAQTIAYGKLMDAGLNEKVRKTKGLRI